MKPVIQYSDFEKLDLRVGKIIAATIPEWSQKLLEFRVDFGSEIGQKTILSGVKAWYVPDDFIGKHYVFVINLAERQMGQGVSQGMMLMADVAGKAIPIPVKKSVPIGTIVR